jgi:hypothetical protein
MSIKFLSMSNLLERLLNGTQKENGSKAIDDAKTHDENERDDAESDEHDAVEKVVKKKKIKKRL